MNVRRIFILGSALTLGVCAVLGAVAMHERDGSSSRRCVAAVGAEGQLCVTAVRAHQYRVTGSFLAPASTVTVRGVRADTGDVLVTIEVGSDGRIVDDRQLVSIPRSATAAAVVASGVGFTGREVS